jgi:multiple sugar transport system substrate-binding protein
MSDQRLSNQERRQSEPWLPGGGPSWPGTTPLTRRSLLRSGLAGVAAVYGLSACGGDNGGGGGGKASGTVTFGSNYSDPVPKKGIHATMDAFTKQSGVKARLNEIDHNTFQEQINNYLQGKPDDVFTWFAGNRMQFFAERGLVGDISDVWGDLGDQYSDAFKKASTGKDGKQYFMPFYNYAWAIWYRKSVFDKHGWKPAKNWDEFMALLKKIKSEGMTPLAFADKDGWPAMGTFDYINMRTNGYDFHIRLMNGDEAWDSPEVKETFKTYASLLPYSQEAALGRLWQDAAQSVADKKSAMMVIGGGQIGIQFKAGKTPTEDLQGMPFPEINPEHGQDAVEAPIDGHMMAKKPKNEAAAKALLKFLGSAKGQDTYLKTDPNDVATNKSADTTHYNSLQKQQAEMIAGAKQISQFMDRDTRPDFASTVMIPSLQQFIKSPDDIDGLTKKIEQQKKTIFVG